jgi:EAL domain-containing protein (putative c-di-GMP-specific phosphodiesterase class I)
METVAEDVETPEQAKILVEAGWEALQGYLYGEPGSFDTLGRANAAGQA